MQQHPEACTLGYSTAVRVGRQGAGCHAGNKDVGGGLGGAPSVRAEAGKVSLASTNMAWWLHLFAENGASGVAAATSRRKRNRCCCCHFSPKNNIFAPLLVSVVALVRGTKYFISRMLLL